MATNPKVEAVSGWRLAVGNHTDSRGDRNRTISRGAIPPSMQAYTYPFGPPATILA